MCPSVNDFKQRYPEFSQVTNQRVQVFLTEACEYLDEMRAEPFYKKLVLLLTAHHLSLSEGYQEGNAGEGLVSSMSDAGASISFATPTPTSNIDYFFQKTPYGVEYLTYCAFLGAGGISV